MATEHASLGILGGTFDPIHLAHLRLAQEACDQLGLERVRIIPAGQPSHRGTPGATAAQRLAMAEHAVRDCPQFEIDAAEVHSDAPSYTVPTLERLRREFGPRRPLVLLLGADAFLGLHRWHRWQELFGLAHIAVATRPGHLLAESAMDPALAGEFRARTNIAERLVDSPAGRIHGFAMTPLEISATSIREQIRTGRSPRFLVPPAVLDYIEAQALYK